MSTILSQLKPLKIGDLTAKLPIIQGGMVQNQVFLMHFHIIALFL